MRRQTLVIAVTVLGVLLGSTGCWIQEDPALLQPSTADSAFVRVLNLAADQQPRTVSIGEQVVISDVGYAQLSSLQVVPADSFTVAIRRGGMELSWQDSIIFRKGTYTTFVVLQKERQGKAYDTVVPLVALAAQPLALYRTAVFRTL